MNIEELLRRAPDASTLDLWLQKVPYAAFLGIRAEVTGSDILFVMPQSEELVGNPSLPAVHGGVVGAFMELAGAFELIAKMDKPVVPKIVNFSLDYLRPVRVQDAYARCHVTRQGRMVANVSVMAWQEDESSPNATARAHFLIPD
ncbi:MAG: PaaI family thioesterase [Halioglobus sp.]|nr:PaaI family thioesterase [Halioglobus sp.]